MADYLTERKSELYLLHIKCSTYGKTHHKKFMQHAMECPAPECARVAGLIRREEAKEDDRNMQREM